MAYPSLSARSKDWGTETLTDADLEAQLDLLHDWINAAFNSSTGHKHDGTTSEGPKILTANIDDSAGTAGDIFKSNGSAITRLALGTAGQVPTVNSGATDIEYQDKTDFASSAEVKTGTESAKAIAPDTLISGEGVIKGWIKFDGTGTPSIDDSFNVDTVTGITDNGTGDYTIPWNTNFANGDYVVVGMARGSSGSFVVVFLDNANAPAAGSVTINCAKDADSADDPADVFLLAIGDR